jgi:hypothetical protein
MLKPYVCVACEKVILATPDNVPSLIGLFSKIVASIPVGSDVPANAVVPKEWAIYSAWDPEPGDEDREYNLCVQILYPDETQFGDIWKNKIKVETGKRSQVTAQILGFPIGQQGFYTIRVWLEQNGPKVSEPIVFKIELERRTEPQR